MQLRRIHIELALMLLALAAALFVSVFFDLFELFQEFARQHEEWDIDELLIALALFSFFSSIFSFRRWAESDRSYKLAKERTAKLESTLTELYSETTARKEIEKEVLASKEHFQNLFESAVDSIFLVDPESGTIIDCNENSAKRLGYTKEELLNLHIAKLNASHDLEKLKSNVQRQMAGEQITFDTMHITKTGELVPMELVSRLIESNGKKMMLAFGRDIRDRKKAELELSKQQSITNQILNALPISLTLKDSEGNYLLSNDAALAAIGKTREEFTGNNARLVIDPKIAEQSEKDYQMLLKNPDPKPTEFPYLVQGESRYFLGQRLLLDVQEEEKPSILTWALDITERKAMEESLVSAKQAAEQANKAKSRFLSLMSHELRTPMNGVLGMAQVLRISDLTEEQKGECDVIISSGEALIGILTDILDLSKIEADRQSITPVPFSPIEIARSVTDLFLGTAKTKSITLSYEVQENIKELLIGDSELLRRILVNLLENAVKFTAQGEVQLKIELTSETLKEQRLLFQVQDSGIGIPEKMLQQIFEPFTQVEDTETRHFEGTGLGLSIVQKLVSLLGGSITLTSTEGQGSCFRFELPFQKEEEAEDSDLKTKEDLEETEQIVSFAGKQILLVEDHEANQLVITKILQNRNAHVDVAGNGVEGLSMSESKSYDLILMDILMPKKNGFVATKEIRESTGNPNQQTPIVALTALATNEDKEKCLECGMNGYVSKPFVLKDLELLIQTLVF